ncbi:MAG: T9SS type A sorting domain-containing protein [Ignavibacteriae bacterium]|nr:T9SS type A sorting domain-containing protein [Ignavibacteriota bacterium]
MKILFYLFCLMTLATEGMNVYGGTKWSKLNFPDNIDGVITSLKVKGDNIFVGTDKSGMFLSNDKGRTFNIVGDSLKGKHISEIVKSKGDVYAVADNKLFRSDDGGVSWILIGMNLPEQEIINCIFISEEEEILVGTDQTLYSSRDGGLNWVNLSIELKTINCIAVTMNEQGFIFLSFSRGGERIDLYRTGDRGDNWEEAEKGIETLPMVSSFALRGNNVYASIYYNIYMTGNNGQDWIKIPGGFQWLIDKVEVSRDEYLLARFGNRLSVYDKEKGEWRQDDAEMNFKDTIRVSDTDDEDNVFIASEREIWMSLGDIKIFVDFYPGYNIIVEDINNNWISNKLFYVIKNGYNIGSVTTDGTGRFTLYVNAGDTIKLEHYPGGFAAVKPGHNTCNGNTMYYVILDNAKFDGTGGRSYFGLGTDMNPTIICDHTTIKMSLIVSVQWDAKRTYLDSLANWFKELSNYYYDVTDGQLFFHQIDIYDNRQKWNDCDVRIWTDNMVWPNASVGGIFSSNADHHANMPRKWFGDSDPSRNGTARNDWLTTPNGNHWTTIGHELGHYMMAFYDEYVYVNSDGSGLPSGYNYGYMDYQYPNGGVWATEMSNLSRYPGNTYEITAQWVYNANDCWADFESDYEKEYNGVFCPIIKPSERTISGGLNYLPGPNINVANNLIENIYDADNSAGDVNITVLDPNMTILTRAKVDLYKPMGMVTLVIKEGQAADDGNFKVIGANVGDAIRVSHFLKILPYFTYSYVYDVTAVTSAEKQQDQIQQEDYIPIILQQVNGTFNQVNTWEFDETGNLIYKAYVNKEFSQNAKLEIPSQQDILEKRDLNYNQGKYEYTCSLDETMRTDGVLSIEAYDDSQQPFYIPMSYNISGFSPILSGPGGDVNLYLDRSNSQIEKFAILSSGSQTSRKGLDEDAEQSGNVHSIATHRFAINDKIESILQIGYSPDELKNKSQSLLRIFKWDASSLIWKKLGGMVDSIRHFVRVPITETGTFAVFTSNDPDAVEDGSLNYKIQISPNPCVDMTNLSITVMKDEIFSIELINSLGNQICILSENTYLPVGNHKLEINTSSLSSGTYFIRLRFGTNYQIVKFVVVK